MFMESFRLAEISWDDSIADVQYFYPKPSKIIDSLINLLESIIILEQTIL